MTIILILAPYATFALLMMLAPAAVALFATVAICLITIAVERIARGRAIKILPAGAVVIFAAIGCYVLFADPGMSISAVKFSVDAGMLLVILASIAIRRPFTLQYAREEVDAETAVLPGFIRANYIISWVWAASMVAMMIGNVALIYVPGLPIWSSLLVAFAARNSAVYFTKWYPEHRKAKYGALPATALTDTH